MGEAMNLNSAGKEELDSIENLRGHGYEIVRFREERGGFTDVDQLDEVPGLTGKVTQETKARLRV